MSTVILVFVAFGVMGATIGIDYFRAASRAVDQQIDAALPDNPRVFGHPLPNRRPL